MKKSIVFILTAILCLSLVACTSNEENNTDVNTSVQSSDEISEEISSNEEDSMKEKKNIDYNNTDMTEWTLYRENADEITEKLIKIDTVTYGSAGSSLRIAGASAEMLSLTKEDKALETLKAYLENMNDLQRDYFSFQWGNVYKSAKELLENSDSAKDLLESAGYEDFNLSEYSQVELEKLNDEIIKCMEEFEITNEWENFSDIEPFAYNK